MKKSVLKGALLFASMAALAVPASASAAGWGPVLSTGHLVSTNTSTYTAGPGLGFNCSNIDLGYKVRSPASYTLDITSGSFTGCVGTYGWAGCTVTWTPAGLPWAVNGAGALHPVINVNLTGMVGGNVGCHFAGSAYPITLTGGLYTTWTAATHTLSYSAGSGSLLTLVEAGIQSHPLYVNGSLYNTSQTLTLT